MTEEEREGMCEKEVIQPIEYNRDTFVVKDIRSIHLNGAENTIRYNNGDTSVLKSSSKDAARSAYDCFLKQFAKDNMLIVETY